MSNDQRRVAILSPIFSNPKQVHGGITPVVANLAKGFAARGLRVDMLVRLPKQVSLPAAPLGEGIRIIDLGTSHRLSTALAVARYCRNEHPDALLAAGHRFNLAAAWAKRLSPRCKIYLSVHNTVSAEAKGGGRWKSWKRWRAISRFYPRADGVICVSQGVADDLLRHAKLKRQQIQVINNPIVTPDLLQQAQQQLDHPWFSPDAEPVILAAGRLAEQKAFDVLLQAFARVRQQRPCRLMILGEGELRTKLAALAATLGIREDVALPGFVTNLPAYMRQAKVFALSSAFEGFGNVLVEAMAVGTPVVSTDCPSGPRDILHAGRYGALVPVGDSEALANAILATLDKPVDRSLLAEAVKRYTVDTITSQYLDYLGLGD
jgi:glycosyltransferase involved in cell wall biosynthesis